MGRVRMRTKLGVAVMAGALAASAANASPDLFRDLPGDARDLNDLRWEKRPVLIFAPSRDDPAYSRQMELLRAQVDALAERDIVVLSDLDADMPSPLRQGFQPGGFRIVLVGKDGGIKLEQEEVLDPETLFSLIDGMPMRRNEMAN